MDLNSTSDHIPFDFDRLSDRRGTGSLKWDKYAGRDVIPLWVADMDFQSPPVVTDALRRRVEHGVFGYTIPYDDVVTATLEYLKRAHDLTVEPDWLVWLPGLVPALNVACRAYAGPATEVLAFTPVYPPFLSAPAFAGGQAIRIPLLHNGDAGWGIDWTALDGAITPTARLLLFCHPHNPVGRVWSRAELERLLKFCITHHLILIADEIHCDLILDRATHVPLLALPDAETCTVGLYSPSKTYNLAGLACAYAVIPDEHLRRTFKRAARGMITEVNAFGYAACAAAYRQGEPWRQALLSYLRENRDLLATFVQKRLPGVSMTPLQATYLAWLDVRSLGLDEPTAFFEKAGVGLSNGADFGCPGFVRLNFGCPRAVLHEGLERMARALGR